MGGIAIERLIDEKRRLQRIAELEDQLQIEERLIYAKRTTRVTKGGKRFSFSALVIVGDKRGFVGFGLGKAREVPIAIAKAIEDGKKHLIRVPIENGTVPHDVSGHYGPTMIKVIPARRGTGIVAGGAAKPIFELAGYTDVLTKLQGSTNPNNVVRAVFDALLKLRSLEEVARDRGLDVELLRKRYHIYARDLRIP
ncbi:MAG: 30S ribosomal protein S5 [Aquificaceae bacterium]|nr:30S ribosomal protein S5 [Aquificaceae bacterium]MCS7195744.1 30S ribosomal protein S5 [Aquificaceae bacterium]MCX7989898.1 30S ribosomal protein S5 [Aquificaceae bacterium]MDW8032448.1 30S ribosomal protein S5 [Aquificaceae bacterium]MDW8294662.1 30S ribosomal protein S5 [Aquificaceae bacterium]